ncbi:Transcriptional regulatory protein YpdB [Neolewinella maritima]|uniref:Transcriptional regulatory protein YpdB n=1 Tax=Neolewinella maritima TaxID=1383882 RepID=A0ABM9AX77_9BACT|nr:response regulator [Neolewinella maritima]CAH0999246.1 Transcriptional regulatory protein YpdB [Neolewinella maritima]
MRNMHILIVEDEPIIAADLQDRLEQLDYTVTGVDTGEAALEHVQQSPPDLILMDVQLAGTLDGVDAAMLIRAEYDIPLIFLTSNSNDATFRRARLAEPSAFLSKPFRGRDLTFAIELALRSAALVASGPAPAAEPTLPEFPRGETAMLFQDRLFIKVKERLARIMLKDIIWVEADDYYCRVYTRNQKYLVTKTLKRFAKLLPTEAPFFRCHRSYLVNLQKVTSIGELYLFVGDQQLPVSRSKRSELIARINNL